MKFDKIMKLEIWTGAKVRKWCRSRDMLQKEYVVCTGKICFDAAENEPFKLCNLRICSSADFGMRTTHDTVLISRPVRDAPVATARSSRRISAKKKTGVSLAKNRPRKGKKLDTKDIDALRHPSFSLLLRHVSVHSRFPLFECRHL